MDAISLSSKMLSYTQSKLAINPKIQNTIKIFQDCSSYNELLIKMWQNSKIESLSQKLVTKNN